MPAAHLPVSEFRQAFNRVLRYPDRLNQFGESAGNLELRQLICDKSFLLRASQPPREVLIVPGSQYGSLLLAADGTPRREHVFILASRATSLPVIFRVSATIYSHTGWILGNRSIRLSANGEGYSLSDA